MTTIPHWTELLRLREEVEASDGGVGELQMSLHKAVYQTVDVPYRDVEYYSEITQHTPNLLGFFSRVARRLAGTGEPNALYHLDQGMGGGKSHALVGLFHMASDPPKFFTTELGQAVRNEAEFHGEKLDFQSARVVTLTADHFTPGKATEIFGPATNLFERFLWGLFSGDRTKWDAFVSMGPNKATIQRALASVATPVLVLLDELMDYILGLSDADSLDKMPSEQAFLNSLMDACDDVPRVAFVVVMIRSELDPEGYSPVAGGMREYVSRRLSRNGPTVAVTESDDFAAIIRRRIFQRTEFEDIARRTARALQEAAQLDGAWETQVLGKLGHGKGSANLVERVVASYPFHPDLMDLVRDDWGRAQGFQRVRSTVSIFALSALHWSRSAEAGEWSPPLIGVGDLPLGGVRGTGKTPQSRCLDALLNSGLLLGSDRAVQGYRAVATTDITTASGEAGRAVEIDRRLRTANIDARQPNPAVRMATALFNYSLVGRAQGRRGATKAELEAALMLPAYGPSAPFTSVEEVFNAVAGPEGLGALEVTPGASGTQRYWLTIKQTLRMYFNSAKVQTQEADAQALVWETAERLASKGTFDELHRVDRPKVTESIDEVARGIDGQSNRLVVLDPRRWSLLNGDDSQSRIEISSLFGVGPQGLVVDNAASCVFATANTYQLRYATQAATEVLTWRLVLSQVVEEDDQSEVKSKLADAEATLNSKVRGAFRHFAYLMRKRGDLEVIFDRFDDDKQSSLAGSDVWSILVLRNRAVGEYYDPIEKRHRRKTLSPLFLSALLDTFDRHLTPKDVVTSFYKDPNFPLVPGLDEIRSAMFGLIQESEQDGDGSGEWELIDSVGTRLNVALPSQLAVSSVQQQLRRIVPPSAPESPSTDDVSSTTVHRELPWNDRQPPAVPPQAVTYTWYRVELTNRSITDDSRRDAVAGHLRWLASKLDHGELDHQLLSIKYELMAAENADLIDDMKNRAGAIEARFNAMNEP